MSEQSEKLARDIRTQLGEFNNEQQPVVLLVRALAHHARGLWKQLHPTVIGTPLDTRNLQNNTPIPTAELMGRDDV